MIDEFPPSQPLFTFDHQDFSEEVGDLPGGSVVVEGESFSVEYLFRLDLLVHLVSSGGDIRNLPEDHLEEDDADRPDISLQAIGFLLHHFRCHGGDSSESGLLHFVEGVNFFGEAQVCDLIDSVMGENVLGLEIPVYDTVLMHFRDAINDLLENKYSFFFGNSLLHVDFGLERAPVAEFDDHDLERFVLVDVEASDDIVAVAEHHQLRLRFAEASANLLHAVAGVEFDCLEVQNFDGHNGLGFIVHALVDCSEGASPDFIVDHVFAD